MRISKGGRAITRRHRAGSARNESGVVMMFVLMAMLLIGAITITVIQLITADVAGGIREQQAGQVFNIAQAGVHYAIGKLELSGANSYTGETITITSGSTTLGTATITVNCIDTGAAPPCYGAHGLYRRIISTGTLPVGGPTRKLVAVVQAPPGSGYALCAYTSLSLQPGAIIYGDVASNGAITMVNGSPVPMIKADTNTPPQFTGLARANGTINCPAGCATEVQGGATPSIPSPPPVCGSVTVTASPGTTNLSVPSSGYTMDSSTGYSWKNVTVPSGTQSGGSCTSFVDLTIVTGAAGTTTVVSMSSLAMQQCDRLVLQGSGNIDLRIGNGGPSMELQLNQNDRFGVLPTDSVSSPSPVPADQLKVEVTPQNPCHAGCGVNINQAGLVAGTFLVPNGEFHVNQNNTFYGAVAADTITFAGPSVAWNYDSTAVLQGIPLQTSGIVFNNLRSWKDQ
jgi:hypothetical protein